MKKNINRISCRLIVAVACLLVSFVIYRGFDSETASIYDAVLVVVTFFALVLATSLWTKFDKQARLNESTLYSVNYQAMRTAKKRNPLNWKRNTRENVS